MYFHGDIIITDPCYFLKDERYRPDLKYPNREDFISFESISDYPDVEKSDILKKFESLKDFDEEILETVKLLESLESKSKTRDFEYEQYEKALKEYEQLTSSDWQKSNYGENLTALGFSTYLTSETYYGDWSCTTYKKEKKEKLGEFCADAGMVGIFLLKEVLEYNPEFEKRLKNSKLATVIKDFKGDVKFNLKDERLIIEGLGNINFYTKQTSF